MAYLLAMLIGLVVASVPWVSIEFL